MRHRARPPRLAAQPWRARGIAAAVGLLPVPATAHQVASGLGPVYDGIIHFASTPEVALPMVALALFAGLRGPRQAQLVLFIVPTVWLLACLATPAAPERMPLLVAAIALLVGGGLLAANLNCPWPVTAGIAVLFGAGLGGLYGSPTGSVFGALGASAGLFVLVALLASISLRLRQTFGIIAIRVAGSWTAALWLLLSGWWVHGHP